MGFSSPSATIMFHARRTCREFIVGRSLSRGSFRIIVTSNSDELFLVELLVLLFPGSPRGDVRIRDLHFPLQINRG